MRTAPHLGRQSPSHCLPSKEHRQKVSVSPLSPVLDQGAGNSPTGNEWSSQVGGRGVEAHATTFDMGILPPIPPHQTMRSAQPPLWRDLFHPHNFGRFGEGP
jgi:hypothetical protein